MIDTIRDINRSIVQNTYTYQIESNTDLRLYLGVQSHLQKGTLFSKLGNKRVQILFIQTSDLSVRSLMTPIH